MCTCHADIDSKQLRRNVNATIYYCFEVSLPREKRMFPFPDAAAE
jgi:hypothetical protein